MALLTRTALRQRIQTAVATIAGLRVSAFAPELFGDDSAREMAGRFAVGLGVTEPAPQDRQLRTADGVYVQTPVTVRLAHKLRADAQVADLDAASDAADTVSRIDDEFVGLEAMTLVDRLLLRSKHLARGSCLIGQRFGGKCTAA